MVYYEPARVIFRWCAANTVWEDTLKNIMRGVFTYGSALSALVATSVLGFTSEAAAQELIVNEFNAVGPTKYLENGSSDTYFGVVQGNGNEWVELVVTEDADIRGYQLLWENDDTTPKSGTITFTNASIWSDVKAGTIITIRGGDTSDVSFSNSCSTPDWWIRIGASDTTYVTQTGSTFQVDNDGWRMKVTDGTNLVQDWVGEPGTKATIWAGSGINSQEVGKLEANPVALPSTNTNYNDGNCSSFGSPNCWNNGASTQSFSGLRVCI